MVAPMSRLTVQTGPGLRAPGRLHLLSSEVGLPTGVERTAQRCRSRVRAVAALVVVGAGVRASGDVSKVERRARLRLFGQADDVVSRHGLVDNRVQHVGAGA